MACGKLINVVYYAGLHAHMSLIVASYQLVAPAAAAASAAAAAAYVT